MCWVITVFTVFFLSLLCLFFPDGETSERNQIWTLIQTLSGCPFTSISLWLIEWITLGLSCDGRLYTMYNKTIHICMGQYAYGFIFISIVQKLSCWWMVWGSLSNVHDLITWKQDWYILFQLFNNRYQCLYFNLKHNKYVLLVLYIYMILALKTNFTIE